MTDAGAGAEPTAAEQEAPPASKGAPKRLPVALSAGSAVAVILVANVLLVVGVAATGAWLGLPVMASLIAGGVTGLLAAPLLASRFWSPIQRNLRAVDDGLQSCREKDFSLRLRVTRDDEVGRLVAHYNAMADSLRREHSDVFARELLLDSLLQRAPMAIVLATSRDRIVYANARARRTFGGAPLAGKRLSEALVRLPQELRDAISRGDGGLVATGGPEGQDEVYRVVQRDVAFSTMQHRLLVIEQITQELRRQEIETWKKVLRVVCHELNNSLAPVSSLLHSARHVATVHGDMRRHDEILDRVEQRVEHLARFLDGYTRFARMPLPRRERVDLAGFLEGLRGMYAFRVEGEVPGKKGWFDPGQIQQVLINLLKNAHEAGGAPEDVTIAASFTEADELLLSVSDRGEGMPEAMLRSAIVPFSSSKPGGGGVGLALCNEVVRGHGGRLVLRSRQNEGTTVTCVLPTAPGEAPPPGP